MKAQNNNSVQDQDGNSSKPLLVIVFDNIRLWFKKEFGILTIEECKKLDLTHCHNIYGDRINHLNCRSIWRNEKGKSFRCHSLM